MGRSDSWALRWAPRVVMAAVAMAVGSAIGGGLAWLDAPDPPDDTTVRALATSLTGVEPERVKRRAIDAEPATNPLISLRAHISPQLKIVAQYPAGVARQAITAAEVEAMAERLRHDGWRDVRVDTQYGSVWGSRDGVRIQYDPGSLTPAADLHVDGPLSGPSVVVVRDAPPGEVLAMLAGGALLAVVAIIGVRSAQRRIQRASGWVGTAVLGGLGLILLAPGTLGSYLVWYVSAIDDTLYPEPAWLAFTLPVTQLPAAAGLIALVAAGASALLRTPAALTREPS